MCKKCGMILFALMIYLSSIGIYAKEPVKQTIYVSEIGNDNNNGSEGSPFKTIDRAAEETKKLANEFENIDVIIENGTYCLDKPLKLNDQNSGKGLITYKGREGEMPLISGGRKIDGFKEVGDGIWKAYANDFNVMRELYVNDKRVYRASTEKEIVGLDDYNDEKTAYNYDGIYFDKRILGDFQHADEIDFRWGIGWKGNSAQVEKIIPDPNDDSRNIAIMKQPYYNFVATVPKWGHPARYDFGFRIENAFELLDTPGEYYFNSETKELFYMPKEGEVMNSAQVYAPLLEKLLIVDGGDGKIVKNIKFEGLRFAHATYLLPQITGYSHGQWGDNFVGRSGDESNTQAAIDINNAQNITISHCTLYGLGGAGVKLAYNATDCSLIGNAIYDIGETGISVGLPNQAFITQTEPAGYKEDMVPRSIAHFSDYGAFGQGVSSIYSGKNGAWTPINDVNTNRLSYLKLEFDVPVHVSEILLTTGANKNFEMLLSNDIDFKNATTVYSQGSVGFTGTLLNVKPSTTGKYKYFMIRKTAVEVFDIEELKVLTNDIAWTKKDVCRNINLSNNYITRIANYYYGGMGICMYHCDGLTIEHNEIYDVPYSAMGLGWGWANYVSSTKGTKVLNNIVDSYNNECHDGGALYTLGRHVGGEIKGNWFKNEHGPFGSIYFDEGSADFKVDNNVVENSVNPIFIWIPSGVDIHVTNTYSNSPRFVNAGTNCTVEKINTFISGNPPAEAKKIMNSAGITEKYIDIKKQVPQSKSYFGNNKMDNLSSVYYHFGTGFYKEWTKKIEEIAVNALKNDRYGNLPGQYSPQAKLVLTERISELTDEKRTTDKTGKGMAERAIRLDSAIKEFEQSLIRYDLEKTLKIANDLLNDSTLHASEEAKNLLRSTILSEGEEYGRLKNLEAAIDNFDKSITKTDINAFKLEGIDALPIIDKEKNTVTLYVDENVNLQNLKASAEISYGSKIYPDFKKNIDFTYPVQTVIKNKCFSEVWTINIKRSKEGIDNQKNWWNWSGEKVQIADNITLPASETPHMYTGKKSNELSVTLAVDTLDEIFGTHIVFDSLNGQLLTMGKEEKNSYFELVIKKSNLYLYRTEWGITKMLYGSSYDKEKKFEEVINTHDFWKEHKENNLQIITNTEGNMKRVVVSINEKVAINTLIGVNNLNSKGYFGIHSPVSNIKLGRNK